MIGLVPPNEAPADIDTAFRVIGQELPDLEVRQETEAEAVSERLQTPDRAAVDEFWASYKAGY
jgi:hypothetical protein